MKTNFLLTFLLSLSLISAGVLQPCQGQSKNKEKGIDELINNVKDIPARIEDFGSMHNTSIDLRNNHKAK